MPETHTATHSDADLIMRLYELGQEPEMRKARRYVVFEFLPESVEDLRKIMLAFGTPESAWLRQAYGYWEMACSFVLRGALSPELFFDNNREMYHVYAKIKPFVQEMRATYEPELFIKMEKVVESTPESRARLQEMEERIKRLQEMRRAQRAQAN